MLRGFYERMCVLVIKLSDVLGVLVTCVGCPGDVCLVSLLSVCRVSFLSVCGVSWCCVSLLSVCRLFW